MATFTDEEKRFLADLRKRVLGRHAGTLPNLSPWQEALGADTALLSDKGAVSADVVRGLAGSWAAAFSYDYGGRFGFDPVVQQQSIYSETGPIVRKQTNRIGQPGVPEINFVPYHADTNAFGYKGPSLIGHPISFEVVGPTLKSPACDWTWTVTIGGGLNGGDLLTMSVRPDGAVATCTTIAQAYNLGNFLIGDLNEPQGGLYVMVSHDGTSPGSLPAGVTAMQPAPAFLQSAGTELFRVSSISGNSIEIHPNKSFTSVFALAVGSFGIRAITLFRPYATRLAALPSQLKGREQNFVVVPPDVSASSDLFPPYDGGIPGDGTWLQGGFTNLTAPSPSVPTGAASQYGGRVLLPIPTPLAEMEATVEAGGAALPSVGVGLWVLEFPGPAPSLEGKILRIYQADHRDTSTPFRFGSTSSCLGYFAVNAVGATTVTLARVPEFRPLDGRVYYGPGPYLQPVFGSGEVAVYFTIHDPIATLWLGGLDLSRIEACRLAPLLSPMWSERFYKKRTTPSKGVPIGASRGKPDRAVFDTRTFNGGGGILQAANPGNLLDLGFRMVLFPARPLANRAVPDWNRPITSQDIIIDPTIDEAQYVDVDYDAGIVRLSHPPPVRNGGDIKPFGIVGTSTNNPRGEVVLFACCVPYSKEVSQRGMGPGVTGKKAAFSRDIVAEIDATNSTYDPAAPFFGPSGIAPNPVEIVLDRIWLGPPTGTVEITEAGEGGKTFGTWNYCGLRTVTAGGKQVSALSMVASSPVASDPTPSQPGETRAVILRRDVSLGLPSFSGDAQVDDYTTDQGYGIALRGSSMRFPRDHISLGLGGETIVNPGPNFGMVDRVVGYLAPSKLSTPPSNPTYTPPVGVFTAYLGEYGILGGMDYQATLGDPRGAQPGGQIGKYSYGTSLIFSATQAVANWHGVISPPTDPTGSDGIIRIDQSFRLTCRFMLEYTDVAQAANFFIGFLQDENGAGTTIPTVEEATLGLGMDPALSALGLFITTGSGFQFIIRGSNGAVATSYSVPAGILAPTSQLLHGPYTLVIESTGQPVAVRLAVYNDEGRLLSSTRASWLDGLPGRSPAAKGMTFVAGVRNTANPPPINLHVFYVSFVQDYTRPQMPLLP